MTVCSYFLRGACKYGDRCRNEHPGTSTFGNQTWTSNSNRVAVPYTAETMSADITPLKDKPLWPLSSYGPAKQEPVVISGLDESPEELRLKAVIALKAGTIDEYAKYEGEKTSGADQTYANARNNIRQLYEQALKASTQTQTSAVSHTAPTLPTSTPLFGVNLSPSLLGGTATTAFGAPAFGQPAFGQAGFGGSASDTSAFGQGTSAFSQSGSAFVQPPAFGSTTSAFTQSSTQPTSVFGKPSQPTSVFGQASQPTSIFGQPSQPASAFGQTMQPTPAFSQPTQPTTSIQTSQPAFGQSSLIKPASGAFGGAAAAAAGGFTAFASQPSAFTSASASSTLPAGATPSQSAFGSTSPQSAFGSAPSAPKSAFGTSQPSTFGVSALVNTLSGPAIQRTSSTGVSSPFASSPMTVTPSSEKPGSGVPDFASAKTSTRIKPGADRYLGLLPSDYNEMMPADVKIAFNGVKFEWGKIPDWIPPADVR